MATIATHSGLRGRPGVELTHDLVERTVAGLVELIRRRELSETVGVARDRRPEGEALAGQVVEAAIAQGADAIDFGVVSTPGAKLASRSRRLGGAVVITGSHLAPELNGLKLVAGPEYGPVDVRELPEPAGEARAPARGRRSRVQTAAEEHVTAICASVDVEGIRSSGLAVGHAGGAGPAAELLLDELGCADGTGRCDVFLHLDADGDRLQLGDERGTLLEAELTFALALLATEPEAVVKGADTSRIVDALAEARGAKLRTVPPGELHLFRALSDAGGDLAGEGNGGVIVPAIGPGRDGLAAGAAIIGLLALRKATVSQLAAELPSFARRRSAVPCAEPGRARELLAEAGRRAAIVDGDPRVGLQVESGPDAWGLVRLSATEPVIRITAEARTEPEAEALHDELHSLVAGLESGL